MTRSNRIASMNYSGRLVLAAGLALAMAPAAAAPGNPGQSQSNPSPGNPSQVDQGPAQMPTQSAPITDETVGKAGAALRDVAKVQQTYTGKINAAGSNDEKRSLSEQADAQAIDAIQSHGLSVQEYSSLVRTAQTDPQLRQRLLKAANGGQ
jgi:hypothetical protein